MCNHFITGIVKKFKTHPWGKKNWSSPSGIRKSRYRGEKTGREQLVLVLTVSRVPAQEMPPAGVGAGVGH